LDIDLGSTTGGPATNLIFENAGFEIIAFKVKIPSLKDFSLLIKVYKKLITEDRNAEEIYKWEAVKHFQFHWDIVNQEFGSVLKQSFGKRQNLMYQVSSWFLDILANQYPIEARTMFENLYDESKNLNSRLKDFQSSSDNIIKKVSQKLNKQLNHQQDERAMSFYLALRFPEKHIIYMNDVYNRFCSYLDIKPFPAGKKYQHFLELTESLKPTIRNDIQLKQLTNSTFTELSWQEGDQSNLIIQDILYRTLKQHPEMLIDNPLEVDNFIIADLVKNKKQMSLNTILYGPPGTGKTYHTINKALEILGEDIAGKNRNEIKTIYDQKIIDGQIVFTTFHQSLSYEDFIEGIKPQEPKNEQAPVTYIVEDGIFKSISKRANSNPELKKQSTDIFSKAKFYKMSLGGLQNLDIHDWCLENSCIALGWGDDKKFDSFKGINDWKTYRDKFKSDYPDLVSNSKYNIQAMYIFQKMEIGDIIVISKGNKIIDAVGKITGEYYWDDSTGFEYYQYRKVEWLATNLNQEPSTFFNKKISQQSIYEFYDPDVKKEKFVEFFKQEVKPLKPHVLIIDEINRGNVSQIFGELITLIEKDKRLGAIEQLEVILPYSKERFGVPGNLYVIGTMNTADRSVEAIDTALRRRFTFEEMRPLPTLLDPYAILCRFSEKYCEINWEDWKKNHLDKALKFYSLLGVSHINIASKIDKLYYDIVEQNKFAPEICKPLLISAGLILEPLIDISLLITVINKRIEILKDRDHQIGHSYFMGIENLDDLIHVFKNSVIPLLQEYFFGDYKKIQLILGRGFIDSASADVIFAVDDDDEFDDKIIYSIRSEAFNSEDYFIAAMGEMKIQ
jgi:DNA polymerase III delta prime subunit